MVSVGVDDVLGEREGGGRLRGDEAGTLPGEGRGDLERDAAKGLNANVAKGDAGAHGEVRRVRGNTRVEIVGGNEESCALRVGELRTGRFRALECGGSGVFRRSGRFAVTLEQDIALGAGWVGWGRRSGLGASERAREGKAYEESRCECSKKIQGSLHYAASRSR